MTDNSSKSKVIGSPNKIFTQKRKVLQEHNETSSKMPRIDLNTLIPLIPKCKENRKTETSKLSFIHRSEQNEKQKNTSTLNENIDLLKIRIHQTANEITSPIIEPTCSKSDDNQKFTENEYEQLKEEIKQAKLEKKELLKKSK